MWNKTLLALAAGALLSGCGGSSSDSVPTQTDTSKPETPKMESISIQFGAVVGQEAVNCLGMETALAGTQNTSPKFKDVRVYVSEVALITANDEIVPVELEQDGIWQYKNVALLDFENATGTCNGNENLNNLVKGQVPAGDYKGVKFTVGVPAEYNFYGIDGDDAVSPLDAAGMNWSWQRGHKHARFDTDTWLFHLGTTGCEVLDAEKEQVDCGGSRPNRPTYTFNNVDIANQKIVFDYAALVASVDISQSGKCMSGSQQAGCTDIYPVLGLDLETGQCANGNCDTQTWVRIDDITAE